MNFTISRSDLNNALHKVVGVVPQKTTIGILTCILMELEDNKLSLTGTDLEISVTHHLEVNAEEGGAVAIPAKMLQEIVKELPDVPINLSSADGEKILLKTEMGEYKISTQPKEDFPHINIEESEQEFKINSTVLNRLTQKTIFAVSTDELRPALTGINVEMTPMDITFVGTDGHRLSKVVYKKFQAPDDVQIKVIVPTKALNLMTRNLSGEENVRVQIGEDHIIFRLKDAVIHSKLINGTYPNYERVLPTDNDKNLQVNRELLLSTLRRISIFTNSLTNQVRLSITNDQITIHSEDIEIGAEGKEVMPGHFNGEWLQIAYNSSYLMDVLRHIDSEEIVFELKDSSSAGILRPAEISEDEDITMLLMPIRINEEEPEETE